MSRVLFSGNNQITMTFKEHEANAKANPIRAVGVDVVKHKNQCDFIVAHTHGKVFKVVDYITGHELDREQNGYGNYVLILHDNNIATLYAHLSNVSVVEGQTVVQGQKLGFMSNTGNAHSGAHLHFETRQYKGTPNKANLHDKSTFTILNAENYLDADLPVNSTPAKAVGFLDYVQIGNDGILRCGGWAYKGKGEQVVTIKLFAGNKAIAQFDMLANKSRPDVKSVMKYNTDKVGFSGAYDMDRLDNNVYTVKAYVGQEVLKNTFTLDWEKELDENSYLDYPSGSGEYYRVRLAYNDEKSSLGSFRKWLGAFNTWNANKDKGYHVYNAEGKQLD